MAEIPAVKRSTGRDRDEWFSLLDAWGAAGRPYREIADWLMGEHDLTRWWAQKLIVEYEQALGFRPPGVRRDGTFEVSASKTVVAPAGRVFDAFVDPKARKGWFAGTLTERSSERPRSARFDWEDGSSRVNVTIAENGGSKSVVTVAHSKLEGADNAQTMKSMWRERLGELKSYLEA